MVDHYRPEVDELEERLDEIEKQVIETPSRVADRRDSGVKRDISRCGAL